MSDDYNKENPPDVITDRRRYERNYDRVFGKKKKGLDKKSKYVKVKIEK